MKKAFMAFMTLASVGMTLSIQADVWTDPDTGITWTYTVSGGNASLENGYSAAISQSTSGALVIPATIKTYPVTNIGDYAFSGCYAITSVTVPNTVTNIGDYAFSGCYALTSVSIPESVTRIGFAVFQGNSRLTSVTLPNSVTHIGDYAFVNCYALTSVTIPSAITRIGQRVFFGTGLTSVTIPNSVTNIHNTAFSNCRGLMSIVVDENNANYKSANGLLLSKDGTILINGVNGEVAIPDGVMRIDQFAFEGLSGLTSVTMPNSVTDIGVNAFWSCSSLTSVMISSSVTNIHSSTFGYCGGLMSIVVDEGNATYKSVNGLLLSKDGILLIHGVNADVVIPNDVTTIGDYAFSNCNGLTNVTISSSVTNIGYRAFANCNGLTSVAIPDSVTNIGGEAFQSCTDLTSVMIGRGVTNIGNYAFEYCWNLSEICVDDDNTAYTSINGVIYDKNVQTLIYCPENVGRLTLPKTVSHVEGNRLPQGLKCLTIDSCQSIDNGLPSSLSELYITDTEWNMPSMNEWDFVNASSDLMIFVDSESRANRIWLGFTLHMAPSWYSYVDTGVKFNLFGGTLTVTNEYGSGVVGRSDMDSSLEDTSVLSRVYDIVIADGITSIADNAFFVDWYWFDSGLAANLKTVSLPNTLKSIGNNAFRGCCNLSSINIPSSVTSIGKDAFLDCGLGGNGGITSIDCCVVKTRDHKISGDTIIPDGTRLIADGTFAGCYSLTSITIPAGVEHIGNEAFYDCLSLTSITIPAGVEHIGSKVFYQCSSLTSVTIPASVKYIEKDAFVGCPAKLYIDPENENFPLRDGQYINLKNGGYVNNTLLAARIVKTTIRESDPTILDVEYFMNGIYDRANVRALAFENGTRSWANVVRPETFVTTVDGTASQIGDNVLVGVTNKFSWRVSSDYTNNLAKLKMEIFVQPEDMLPLDFMTIPAYQDKPALEFSFNTLTDVNVLNALYWLYADGDQSMTLSKGVLKNGSTQLASGTTLNAANAAQYVIRKQGYTPLSSANYLNYVNAETRLGLSPSGVRQYAVKEISE